MKSPAAHRIARLSSAPPTPAAGYDALYMSSAYGQLAAKSSSGTVRNLAYEAVYNVKDYGATGDGSTNDATAIQAALDLASSTNPGSQLFFPPGNYKISSELEIKGAVHINCAPGARIVRGSTSMQYMIKNFNSGYAPTGYGGRGNIRMTGGIWDGVGQTLTGNCTLIVLAHCRNVLIEGLQVRNVPDWHGIELNAVSNGVVRDCTFEGFNLITAGREISEACQIDLPTSSAALPGIGAGAYDNTPCENIRFIGNFAGPAQDGSGLGSFGKLFGSHNDVASTYQTNIQVIGNCAVGLINHGVQAYGWSQVVIANNALEDTALTGIKAMFADATAPTDFVIAANTIKGYGESGIDVDGSGGSFQRVTVASNLIEDLTDTANNQPGIALWSTSDFTVTGNNVSDADTSGIYCDTCSKGAIVGNYVRGTGSQGISFSGSSLCLIANNRIQETGQNGIFLSATSANNSIVGNYILGAGRATNATYDSIGLSGAAGNVNTFITGNTCAKFGSGNDTRAALGLAGSGPTGTKFVGNYLRGFTTTNISNMISGGGATIQFTIAGATAGISSLGVAPSASNFHNQY